jgi:hypothetical protein
MPFSNLAARPREDHPARPANPLAPPFYPIGLLPTMQGLLAAVADLETRYEIEREQIEQGPGSEDDKQRRLAELRAACEDGRGVHEARWAERQGKAHGIWRSANSHCTPTKSGAAGLYVRCWARCLFISNMVTRFLPNTAWSFSSAMISRLFCGSWSLFFLM